MATINIEGALERFDNEVDIYLEIGEAFLESGNIDSQGIAAAFAAGDPKKALYFAHKIKGAALTVGADGLASLAGKLESGLRSDETADYADLAASIARETSLVLAEMAEIIQKLKTPS